MNVKVVGVGGAGCHAVSRMLAEGAGGPMAGLPSVEFLSIDTDWAAVRACRTQHKVELRGVPFPGLGSGGKADWAARNAEVCADDLRAALTGADLVLLVAGMGGGTGSGAGPVVARLAREMGALTLGIVTRPLTLERARRAQVAEEGLGELTAEADSVVVVPCEGVLQIVGGKLTIAQFFGAVDGVLQEGVRALAELATLPGLVCLDFADIQAVFRGSGRAVLGIGQASGSHCAAAAAKAALVSPTLDVPLSRAQQVIFQVRGGSDLIVQDIVDARYVVGGTLREDAGVVYNAMVDPEAADAVTVTVFATAFAPSADVDGSAA